MLPVARIGDQVVFGCGVQSIISGSPKFTIGGKPASRIGDAVSCGGAIISGSPKFTEIGQPLSRVTDKAVCPPPCGTGTIITGASDYFES